MQRAKKLLKYFKNILNIDVEIMIQNMEHNFKNI